MKQKTDKYEKQLKKQLKQLLKKYETPLGLIALAVMAFLYFFDNKSDIDSAAPLAKDELVMRVRSSDKLYVTEYVVHKIVTYDDVVRLRGSALGKQFDLRLPQGQRKVLIPMDARVKAYIDFSGFSPDNVCFNADSTVVVTLPDPQIVVASTKIHHAGIKSFVDFGRSSFTNAEMADFEAQGRAAIVETIPTLGIEETARMHAAQLIVPLLQQMGYSADRITVNFRKDFDDNDYIQNLIQIPRD